MVLQFTATIYTYLQFMLHEMLLPMLSVLYLCISTFQNMCAVPNMVGICSLMITQFLGMLLMYILNDSEMIPSAPSINGITLFLHSRHAVFLLYSLYILPSSQMFT